MDRSLLDKLVREIARAETQAIEHAPREARRIGNAPPVIALRAVAEHAATMRPRFLAMAGGHEVPIKRAGIGVSFATLRQVVTSDPERAFRTALLDLRHGVELVKLLRETARTEMLFGMIRWCDDWLGARRTLLARVEAQLAWYVEDGADGSTFTETFETVSRPGDESPWHDDRNTDDRHEQERFPAGTSTGEETNRGDEVPTAKL
jgi:hypothetical protein